MKTVRVFVIDVNIQLYYIPANPLLGIYPREWQYTRMSIVALFIIGNSWKQLTYLSTECINTLWDVHGILLNNKK